jgi:hypothetical protein
MQAGLRLIDIEARKKKVELVGKMILEFGSIEINVEKVTMVVRLNPECSPVFKALIAMPWDASNDVVMQIHNILQDLGVFLSGPHSEFGKTWAIDIVGIESIHFLLRNGFLWGVPQNIVIEIISCTYGGKFTQNRHYYFRAEEEQMKPEETIKEASSLENQ